jgi:hypothetical protein
VRRGLPGRRGQAQVGQVRAQLLVARSTGCENSEHGLLEQSLVRTGPRDLTGACGRLRCVATSTPAAETSLSLGSPSRASTVTVSPTRLGGTL